MVPLLQSDFITYLRSRKPSVPVDPASPTILHKQTTAASFDIEDTQQMITGTRAGNVTYNNPNNADVHIIAYEDFLNQLPNNLTRNIKRCDFIVYHNEDDSVFILNELSQGSPESKLSKAQNQLSATLLIFSRVPSIWSFVLGFTRKECIISIRSTLNNSSPQGIANAFTNISNMLPFPTPNEIRFQPIMKLGFRLLETDTVSI